MTTADKKEKARESARKWRLNNPEKAREHVYSSETRNILKHHHDDMADDPERLSTEFIIKLVHMDGE